jgi:hypothetical protein
MSTPQFGTAEYEQKPGVDACKTCGQTIFGKYFRVSGAITCPSCAELTARGLPTDTHGAYVRGLVFGVVGAILGLIIYSVFSIATGFTIGYISLLVGYIVGRAVLMGASGRGGRRYQIAAALLTYAAVSISAVPISLWLSSKESANKPAITEPAAQPADATVVEEESATPAAPAPPESSPSLLGVIAFLVVLGLSSPFLELSGEPVSGLIGLVILFVGIRIAWKMTAGSGIQITGPYNA